MLIPPYSSTIFAFLTLDLSNKGIIIKMLFMRTIIVLAICVFGLGSIYSQSVGSYVISSAGDDLMSENGGLYISIGEALNTEIDEGDLMISQGFLQVTVNGNSVAADQLLRENIKVYPNPVRQYLMMEFEDNKSQYFYRLIDQSGHELMIGEIDSSKKLSLGSLQEGMYYITIIKDDLVSETIKVFKTK